MVMHIQGDASTSCRPADAAIQHRCRQSVGRAWRQPARLFQHPVPAGHGYARVRHHQAQLLTPAAAASAAEAAPQWGPESSALVPLEDAKPAPRRPGYRSFAMDTCEFLVAETPDGQLDLQDVYVLDADSDVTARAEMGGELPRAPAHYQAVEVGAEYLGNVLEEKVFRVYLLPVLSQDPYELDLRRCYLLDHKARSVSQCPVTWLAPEDTAPHNLRLRVRGAGLTVESVESLPSWEEVVLAQQAGLSALSVVEKGMLERASAGELGWEEVKAVVGEELVRLWQGQGEGEVSGFAEEAPREPEHFNSDKLEDNIDENLKDLIAEYDDENEEEFEDFDSPAVDF